ncbi:MAG: HAD family hydrolase [Thermoplasmata archaeon]
MGILLPLALLLDVDGTLFDTLDTILSTMNAALDELGEPPLKLEELRPLIGMPVRRQMAILRGMEGPIVNEITERYYRHFVEHAARGLGLYPGVKETLAALSDRPIGTITTRRREVARIMLRAVGINGYFEAIVGGDEVSLPKPNPDLVFHAARAIEVPPERCVVVGDAAVDILAGKAAGAWAVAAIYGYGKIASLQEAGPHAEISEFSELARVLEGLEAGVGES